MSNTNIPPSQPTPLETEAYLELPSPTIDVFAVAANDTDNFDAETNQLAPLAETETTGDGFLIARKLRQHNRELVKTVVQLEQALAESQERLQSQITRSRSADSLLSQQAADLTSNQTQLSRLSRELEKAKQNAQDYQEMTAELEHKFQISQTQLAQIERECSLLQESYNEQQQRLFTAEQEIQDLQTRLQRQQRYTLQYKSALEQRTEVPEEIEPASTNHQMPKVSRIQPWSDQLRQSSPMPQVNNGGVVPFPTAKAEPIAEIPVSEILEIPTEIPTEIPVSEAAAIVLPPEPNGDLEQQLEALELEMETISQAVSEPALPVVKVKSVPQFPSLVSMKAAPREIMPSTKRRIMAPMGASPLPQQKNWPSPTLNALRTEKKHSSLASVDLPSFPRR